MLRIGIEASGLAAPKPATGLQRYSAMLIERLAALRESEGFELLLYSSNPLPARLPDSVEPLRALAWRIAPLARGWHRALLGAWLARDRADVVHFPAPLMARFCPIPAVVTFHDLAALSLGGQVTQKESRYLSDALDAGRRASAIIAVSESAGDEVRHHLRRTDVTVIPEGVDTRRFRPSPTAAAQVRDAFGLPQPYLLCVGTLQARKNHVALVQAFERMQADVPHTLVIAGGDGSGAAALHDYLAAHPNPRVRLLGYVDESLLPPLYAAADGLALPSLWEGFGLPLLEAMACRVPVLTSAIASLREVGEGAAVLVDPARVDDIAAGLKALLTDAPLRARLIEAGDARVQDYTWEQAARRTLAVYRAVRR